MHRFDYSFLDNGLLPAQIVNVTSSISAFNAISNHRKQDFESVYSELVSIARIQSVKSSNAIEGIITTDARIKDIVNKNSAPLSHNEQEIAGYRDALDEVHTNNNLLVFDEELVLHLHEIMYRYTSLNIGGHYKDEDNIITEIDEYGRRRVRFMPVHARDTAEAMQQLILAYMDARSNPNINKLLLIPCVILDFLCIHPFTDGNGRLSRLLSILLLYKSGFDVSKYISFEEQINRKKDFYYSALQESSVNWHESENDYVPFMYNFLSTLYNCYKELDKRFSTVNGKRITKTERIEQTVLNSVLPVSKAEISEILPDVSVDTIAKVLKSMQKEGMIKRIGSTKSAKYVNAKYLND